MTRPLAGLQFPPGARIANERRFLRQGDDWIKKEPWPEPCQFARLSLQAFRGVHVIAKSGPRDLVGHRFGARADRKRLMVSQATAALAPSLRIK